ncbi:MAG: Na+/H+ antiporter NhaA [Zetaproteobacteria bacterium CG02_land_8_20_14_3_00_50_9]|nr:MAG: Na+/H+ antiporter NhaA [Zetaproteobacteria bacterium CG1_02_49_23]PIQ34143.1 MAG: Na+/H+ antiporter NhaA [Zetaproteobacteria bacterium CG17_big_fil_post_rev_8_21_14_2_50_50_13]PIV30769.1 MAG: Na+/H+ antiporter NhaA [Zetaproteobacteria bacterium CG02_land_8_20_14_3_00_50_9]PIY54965.1 MAG: Na+/H+ antiporter NhaA [Zetaproteobacteria bacterium CG_4_10_14_0_8_um_filter_49_80]
MANDARNLLQRGLENIHHPFSNFIHAQRTSSLFLLLATIVALWWANSAFSSTYQNLVHTPIGFYVGEFELQASLKHIINDGLMVIFFFLLGLEIKREVLAGDLAQAENRRMLILCAVGGMVCPALIYSLFNVSLDSQIGWGIPMATDTAFALGVLTLVRKQIPLSLLAFIVGLAIVDDIGAILVIALFYTQQISVLHLISAFALIAFLATGNRAGVRQPFFYFIIGVATWWMVLKSGVHPTVAGVAIALTVPANPRLASGKLLDKAKSNISAMQRKTKYVDVLGSKQNHEQVLELREVAEGASTPLRRWEDALGLPVALLILPLFALTNAGVVFGFSTFIESLQHPTGLGIITGLVLGKFIGISGACWLGLRYKIGCLPAGIRFQHVIGVSLIAGIGFTMSTFIATLGFDGQPGHLHNAKTSILVASILSAILGLLYIRFIATKELPVVKKR